MINESDLKEVKNYVIQILPQLLQQEPGVLTTIESIIAKQFPRRDEFTRLLDEVKLLRENMERRFLQVDNRIDLLRADMEQRFEQVDKRLAQVDKHLEQVDKRLEQVDNRIDLLRADMERRFEQADRRIDLMHEDMEQRFLQVERRFEQVDKRIDLMREDMERRFELADKRFDDMHKTQLGMKRDILKIQESQDRVIRRLDLQENWFKIVTGRMGTEKGQLLEEMFASGLSYGLKNPDIKPESILLRQHISDDGEILKGYPYYGEVDLIAEDGKLTVFEVKATALINDVDTFALKIRVVKALNPDKDVHGVLISIGASSRVNDYCKKHGLELVN